MINILFFFFFKLSQHYKYSTCTLYLLIFVIYMICCNPDNVCIKTLQEWNYHIFFKYFMTMQYFESYSIKYSTELFLDMYCQFHTAKFIQTVG